MTAQTLRLANAGAQLPCKGYGGGHPVGYGCLECGGSGWVYALPDAVRVPCPGPGIEWDDSLGRSWTQCYYWVYEQTQGRGQVDKDYLAEYPCPCDKRGWVPATDGWAFLEAVTKMFGISFSYVDDRYDSSICEGLELAFHTALNKALTAEGASFP